MLLIKSKNINFRSIFYEKIKHFEWCLICAKLEGQLALVDPYELEDASPESNANVLVRLVEIFLYTFCLMNAVFRSPDTIIMLEYIGRTREQYINLSIYTSWKSLANAVFRSLDTITLFECIGRTRQQCSNLSIYTSWKSLPSIVNQSIWSKKSAPRQ